MSEKSIEIDRRFDIPLELRTVLVYKDGTEVSGTGQQQSIINQGVINPNASVSSTLFDTPTPGPVLNFPNNLTIVNQVIHTLADGTQLVDVVVEIEDIPGADHYEIQIVKAG